MERSTVMRKSISSKQPMFNIIEPSPPPYISFPEAKTTTINIDASFSSYLNPPSKEPGNNICSGNQPVDSEISIFDAQKYFNDSSNDPKLSKRVSSVNNVINPERCEYFSSVPRLSSASSSVDGYGRNYRARSFHTTPTASSEASWNSQTGLLSNPPGVVGVSMRNPGGQDKAKKGSGTKWLLGRRCPCSGKKSVQVEDNLSEPPPPPPRTPSRSIHGSRLPHKRQSTNNIPDHSVDHGSVDQSSVTSDYWHERQEIMEVPRTQRISADNNRFPLSTHHQNQFQHRRVVASAPRPFGDGGNNGFTFPILSQSTTTTTTPIKLVLNGLPLTNHSSNPSLEDPPRDSLEVFRPPADDSIPIKSTAETHRRPSFTFPASPKSRMTITEDDMASDASSDLFEIESFSTQTTSYQMYNNNNNNNRRDSLDEASSFNARRGVQGSIYRGSLDEPMTPSITEGYEPSEASIDWSVTTAEGFDRASVTNYSVSEADEMFMTRYNQHHHQHQNQEAAKKKRPSGGGGGNGGLLSCRCEKAVSVGPNPVRCVGNEGQRVTNSALKHVSSRAPPPPVPPPLPVLPVINKSHTNRLSMSFAA